MRNELQQKFANICLDKRRGLVWVCSRFGKIKVCLNFLKPEDKVLLIYPKVAIKQSWIEDSKKWDFDLSNFVFTTTASLSKYENQKFDWVIYDEIQEVLSEKVLINLINLSKNNPNFLGLSGSLSDNTLNTLNQVLNLNPICTYTTEEGIRDGIICDYEINVKYCKLDDNKRKQYNYYTYKLEELKKARDYKSMKFIALNRMRLLHNSNNKILLAKKHISNNKDKRLLLFTHLTAFADSLDIPVYHSKNKDDNTLNLFKKGEIPHLVSLDMIGAGISFQNLNNVVICSFTSNEEELYQRINRITALEMNNPNKKAMVTILCIKDTQEEVWLAKALSMFNKEKINYV